jgi:hypothetical protein
LGDRLGALGEFDRFARSLRGKMQIDPMPETVGLRDLILRADPLRSRPMQRKRMRRGRTARRRRRCSPSLAARARCRRSRPASRRSRGGERARRPSLGPAAERSMPSGTLRVAGHEARFEAVRFGVLVAQRVRAARS